MASARDQQSDSSLQLITMARALFVLTLALLASAVLAEYIYSDDQIDEINDRLAKCLNGKMVPPFGDFDRPGDRCRFDGGINNLAEGATKEQLTAPIVACLKKAGVAAKNIAKAQACLVALLAKPLVSK